MSRAALNETAHREVVGFGDNKRQQTTHTTTRVSNARARRAVDLVGYAVRLRPQLYAGTSEPLEQVAQEAGTDELALSDQVGTSRIVKRPVPYVRNFHDSDTFVSIQSWEGVVEDVLSTRFVAHLIDEGDEEELVEIPLEEISTADMPLIQPGARFYWSIGYQERPTGTRYRTSVIRFRRITEKTADAKRGLADQVSTKVGEAWLSL